MTRQTRRQWMAASTLALLARKVRALPLSDIKLGILTDEIDDDVSTAARFLKQYGLQWAEIRNIWGPYNTEQPMDKIREARSILDANGIRVSIEGTGFFKIPLPPETPEGQKRLDQQWALLDRGFERAKAFDTDKLRIFTFMLARGEQPSEKSYARIDELVREAARRAKTAGFRLAVENIGGGHVATGAQAGALLKRVKDDNLGINWDPNNAGESGEQAFPDGYRQLDPARIFHVHLRDFRHVNGKVVWTAVGDGEFDNLGQIRALRKDGYRSTFTLETHWRDPRGKMYSTETSLKGLLKVVAQV
ncbi:MAG TPA: sugar phosphate isomerase/epimerase family protein [Bryobacteraceae bacterium]|nr:sugar phosphate isomerase/epimerase family protein [Bryobacteraceae bacterium]